MITLRQAREEAKKLVDGEYKIPSVSTLWDWRSHGCLTKPESYTNKGRGGGRVGLYKENLPLQIVVTVRLKKDYKLERIAEARKECLPKLKNGKSAKDLKTDRQIEDSENILKMTFPEDGSLSPEELTELRKELDKGKLIQDYLETWAEFEEEYERKKAKH